jgi:hypothetical protein
MCGRDNLGNREAAPHSGLLGASKAARDLEPALMSASDEEFGSVTRGYLRSPSNTLWKYEKELGGLLKRRKITLEPIVYNRDGVPLGANIHERGIYAAIRWGMANPKKWDEGLKPIKLPPPRFIEGKS